MRISDWSSDVCSSDLLDDRVAVAVDADLDRVGVAEQVVDVAEDFLVRADEEEAEAIALALAQLVQRQRSVQVLVLDVGVDLAVRVAGQVGDDAAAGRFLVEARSEEHTSELQSLMRISYAVFCLKKKKH